MKSLTRIHHAPAFFLLLVLLCAHSHASDVRDRAIDFFSLLKNHLLPQRPAAPDPSSSNAQHTEVRGNCLHEYYAIQAGVPMTITSTNYPGPYPPGECRKLVLSPADEYTAVVMVCTDVDTMGTGVLGRVSGDMLEFPGPVVNRKVHTVYGVDVTQCAAVPFAKRSAAGQALKMGFFSDDFLQRRGFSCQVWGEAVTAPVPGQEEYGPGPNDPVEAGGPHLQHQHQFQHQQRPQILQHQFQPNPTKQQQQQLHQQPFQQHLAQQHQFQQQEYQQQQQFQSQPSQQQQFQPQPFQQQQFQQHEFQSQEQFQPQPEQQEFKEQQQQQPPNAQSLITSGLQQALPLLNIPGYNRPSPGSGNSPVPQRRPANIGALQGLANLFVPYSPPRQGRPSRPRGGLRGPSRGSRGGPRRPRRLGRPRQRVAYRQRIGHVRFPGQHRRRRRSLADLLKARILTGDRESDIKRFKTKKVSPPPAFGDGESQWNAVHVNNDLSEHNHASNSDPSDVFRPHQDSNGFTPPEKYEYIFTPVRFPVPFDPKRKGPPPFYRRERITSNTTESPVKVVPYVVTPGPVVLRATTDGAHIMSHLRPLRPAQFPTTPPSKVQRVQTSRRPVVRTTAKGTTTKRTEAEKVTMKPNQRPTEEKVTTRRTAQPTETTAQPTMASTTQHPQAKKPRTTSRSTTVRPKKTTTRSSLERIDNDNIESELEVAKEGSKKEEVSVVGEEGGKIGGYGKKGGTKVSPKRRNRPKHTEEVEEASQPVRRVDNPTPKPKQRTTQKPKEKQSKPDEDRPNEEGCGLAGPAVQARVFGGEDALPGSYPWVVYLVSDSPKATTKTTYCTGSLISRRWVLTAAHCIDYAVSTTISMGYLDVSKETNLTLKMESSDYRVHRYWTRLAKDHDVGLVKLPKDVPWTEHVRPICLPRRSEVGNTFVDARAEICGWGKTYTDQKGGSFVLQRAEVPIRSNCDCMASFPINITPLKICAHGRFHSPCKGDSGGPLQFRRNGRYSLLGVSSFTSSQGCDVGMPAIYTRVTAYLDWIEHNSGLVVPL